VHVTPNKGDPQIQNLEEERVVIQFGDIYTVNVNMQLTTRALVFQDLLYVAQAQ
jgi:hypothetical protein